MKTSGMAQSNRSRCGRSLLLSAGFALALAAWGSGEDLGGGSGDTREHGIPAAGHEAAPAGGSHGAAGAHPPAAAAGPHHGPEPLLELPEFLPNFLSFLLFRDQGGGQHSPVILWLHTYAWENVAFSLLTALLLVLLVRILWSSARGKAEVPTRKQAFLEIIVEGLDNLVCGVLGPAGRRYTPFIGCLFLYIWCMNMQGLIPGLKSPTSYVGVTAGLAAIVFFYVQYVGIRENGVGGYLRHLAGSPADLVGWLMAPLMLVLHVIGELIKPLSLSLRLFGNILGEDSLIGVFALLGVVLLSAMTGGPTTLEGMMGLKAQYSEAQLAGWQWFGFPLQLPFMMLALLTGTIQALVFALLSTIYIFLMLPHDSHGSAGHGKHGGH
jgi:F-type H+-transporting ATPase subunit a